MTDRLYEWPGDDAPIAVLCLPVSALYGQRREEPVEEAAPVDNRPRRKKTLAERQAADRAIRRLCLEGWDIAEMVAEVNMNSTTIGDRIKAMSIRDEWMAAKQFRRVRPTK